MSEDFSLASFETALDDLKRIVEDMESGKLSLEASLAAFERGVALTRQCQSALSQAQLRVQMLTNDGLVDLPGPGPSANDEHDTEADDDAAGETP